jgi:gamma-glutamylcyclotransferase (GGCT)/AIG2-like uncharacterized protein YtfP
MKLFVYGTLKRGCARNYLLAASEYLTDAYISEHKLITTHMGIDSYPILVHTGNILDITMGEVWEVPDTVVDFLNKHIEIGYALTPLYSYDDEEYVYGFTMPDVSRQSKSAPYVWKDIVKPCIVAGLN